MTFLKSLSKREPDPHSFTQMLCFSESSVMVSFERKMQALSPSLKNVRKQPTVEWILSEWEDYVVYPNNVLSTCQPFIRSLNWPSAVNTSGSWEYIPASKSSGAKILVEEQSRTWKRDLGLVKGCHLAYFAIRKLLLFFKKYIYFPISFPQ